MDIRKLSRVCDSSDNDDTVKWDDIEVGGKYNITYRSKDLDVEVLYKERGVLILVVLEALDETEVDKLRGKDYDYYQDFEYESEIDESKVHYDDDYVIFLDKGGKQHKGEVVDGSLSKDDSDYVVPFRKI